MSFPYICKLLGAGIPYLSARCVITFKGFKGIKEWNLVIEHVGWNVGNVRKIYINMCTCKVSGFFVLTRTFNLIIKCVIIYLLLTLVWLIKRKDFWKIFIGIEYRTKVTFQFYLLLFFHTYKGYNYINANTLSLFRVGLSTNPY